MTHQNRGRDIDRPGRNPLPAEIRAAREAARMTQTEAARLVYCTLTAFQKWEAGERRMHPATWELWQRKVAERQG